MTGRVSTVRGRRQRPALQAITLAAWVLAGLGAVTGDRWSGVAGTVAVAVVTATPLLRIGWLAIRWVQERDWRFLSVAIGLLAVVALGAAIAYVGVRPG